MAQVEQDSETSGSSLDESLEQKIHDLRNDVAALAELISKQLEREARLGDDHSNERPKSEDHKDHLGSKELRHFLHFIEDYVKKEPNKAMTLATAVGFLFGLFVSRGRRS